MTTTTLEVARGRTVKHDGQIYPSGSTIALPVEDAAELLRTGAAIRPGDSQPVPGQIIRPMSSAEIDALPPGPIPIGAGTAIGPRVYTR
jgi:hypothetical protein